MIVMITVVAALPFTMFGMVFVFPVFGFVAVADHDLVAMISIGGILTDMVVVVQIRPGFVQDDLIGMVHVGMIAVGQRRGKYAASAFPIDVAASGDIIINIIFR